MSDKFPISTDRSWNECCDKHGWWVKSTVTQECPWCYNGLNKNDRGE